MRFIKFFRKSNNDVAINLSTFVDLFNLSDSKSYLNSSVKGAPSKVSDDIKF